MSATLRDAHNRQGFVDARAAAMLAAPTILQPHRRVFAGPLPYPAAQVAGPNTPSAQRLLVQALEVAHQLAQVAEIAAPGAIA